MTPLFKLWISLIISNKMQTVLVMWATKLSKPHLAQIWLFRPKTMNIVMTWCLKILAQKFQQIPKLMQSQKDYKHPNLMSILVYKNKSPNKRNIYLVIRNIWKNLNESVERYAIRIEKILKATMKVNRKYFQYWLSISTLLPVMLLNLN